MDGRLRSRCRSARGAEGLQGAVLFRLSGALSLLWLMLVAETVQNKDVAILHEPSKTLIEADLLFNIPAQEQLPEGKKGFLPMSLIKSFSPYTAFHRVRPPLARPSRARLTCEQRFLWYAVSDRKCVTYSFHSVPR